MSEAGVRSSLQAKKSVHRTKKERSPDLKRALTPSQTINQLISNPQFRLESAVSVQLMPDLSDPKLFFVGKYLQG